MRKRPKIGTGPRRIDQKARRLRRECKREGMDFSGAINYAIKHLGMKRKDAVLAARKAYRYNFFRPSTSTGWLVQQGVSL